MEFRIPRIEYYLSKITKQNQGMSNKKGDELMKQVCVDWVIQRKGEARLNKFSLFNKTGKFEDAAELFKKAANQYKVAQYWPEAGAAFGRAAECYIQLGQNHDAASAYIDAAVCMKKVVDDSFLKDQSDLDKAVELYQEAIALFCDMGRFANAAKLEKEVGEMYESNNESEKCVQHYQKAADYFMGEDSVAASNQCLLKVAHFSALMEKYEDAIRIYEQVAQACLEKNVLKFNAKGHLLCAGILHLVRGVWIQENA